MEYLSPSCCQCGAWHWRQPWEWESNIENKKLPLPHNTPLLFADSRHFLCMAWALKDCCSPQRFFEGSRRFCLIKNNGESILDYPGEPNAIARVLKEQVREEDRSEWCNMKTTWPTVAGSEGGGRDHKPRNVGSFVKGKNMDSLLEPIQKEAQPCCHLDFSETHLELQNCKLINLCCFKLLNLW